MDNCESETGRENFPQISQNSADFCESETEKRNKMTEDFMQKLESFYRDFGEARKMVLSTSSKEKVSSRMMSIVQKSGIFYFQTDLGFRKFQQIKENPNVALCIDNFQIEGICKKIGHPQENPDFCRLYQENFKSSFERYSSLKNERLFVIVPNFIERWLYQNKKPFIETFDFEHKIYKFEEYKGE